jgi:hypothetical protein
LIKYPCQNIFDQNAFRVIFWPMSDSNLPPTTPQFSTAEYSESSISHCAACKQPITGRYYSVNAKTACESCVQQLKRRFPADSHSAYMRALLFGVGGAIIGMILYAAFTIVTGLYIGYVSLAVGWLVGKAIMLGSNGIGGRRYQIAAVILTYAAVSIAAVPIAVSYRMKEKAHSSSIHTKSQQSSDDSQTGQPDQELAKPKPDMGAALVQLLMIGLVSPFLELQDPLHGIIGLVILVVGIRIAWRMTAGSSRVNIQGPYDKSVAASV